MVNRKIAFFIGLILQFCICSASSYGQSEIVIEGSTYERSQDGTLTYYNPTLTTSQFKIIGKKLRYSPEEEYILIEEETTIAASNYLISGQKIHYDTKTEILTIYEAHMSGESTVFLSGLANSITGTNATPTNPKIYIQAKKLVFHKNNIFEIYDGSFTNSNPGSPGWSFHGSYIHFDLNNFAYGFNLTFEIHNIPTIYLPFYSWPTKNTRSTGMLGLEYSVEEGNSDHTMRHGTRLKTPYFFNFGQDHGFTLTPDIIEKRGIGFRGEYDYAFFTGMRGSLDFWGIDETQFIFDRSPTPRGVGREYGIPTEEAQKNGITLSDDRPHRYYFDFKHRQNLLGGIVDYQYLENSDSKINYEYFPSRPNPKTYRHEGASFQYTWSGGGASIQTKRQEQFSEPIHLYEKKTDYETALNYNPELTVSQTFSRIGDTPLSIFLKGTNTQFQRLYGWSGRRNISSGKVTFPFQLGFFNISTSYTQTYSGYQVNYNLSPTEELAEEKRRNLEALQDSTTEEDALIVQPDYNSPTDFYNDIPREFDWQIGQKDLEINFEIYRNFFNSENVATHQLSITPRLIYTEIEDVDQRASLNTSPSAFTLEGTGNDYSTYSHMFDGIDQQKAKKTITLRFDTKFREKDLAKDTISDLYELNLIQTYDLNRGVKEDVFYDETEKYASKNKTTREQNRDQTLGPQTTEKNTDPRYQFQATPLIVELKLTPSPRFNGTITQTYDHYLKKFISSELTLKIIDWDQSYFSLTHKASESSKTFSLNGLYKFNDHFDFSYSGTWSYIRTIYSIDSDSSSTSLNQRLTAANLGLIYRGNGYDIYANYIEDISSGTTTSPSESLNRRVIITFTTSIFSAKDQVIFSQTPPIEPLPVDIEKDTPDDVQP